MASNPTGKYCQCIEKLPPSVQDLVYWRAPVKSAIVMIAGFTVLLSLGCLSMISVFSYACIAILCCTGAWRVYYDFVKSKKEGAEASPSPFGDWLSKDVVISPERVSNVVNSAFDKSSDSINYFRHVLLFESYMDSFKFTLYMYLPSIIGGFFNLITIVTIGFALLFSTPKIYELYQSQIDQALDKAHVELDNAWKKISVQLDKIPMLRKQKEN